MTREFHVTLIGHTSAAGELLASDALGLIASFKDVTYRLTRAVAHRSGLGRTTAAVEKLATVRIALREGSTRLVFIVGDESALVDPVADNVDELFAAIVEGMELQRRPPGVSDSIAGAIDDLIGALVKAAPEIEIRVPGRRPRHFATRSLSREPWQRSTTTPSEAVLHGSLEMVDLRSARFRLRDAVGNAVDLVDVVDAEDVAHLVGEHVTATGLLCIGEGTQHHRLERPVVSPALPVEVRLDVPSPPGLDEVVAAVRTAPAPGALDLTDEEVREFLAGIRA